MGLTQREYPIILILHKENGYIFEAKTNYWTKDAPYNKYQTTNIYMSEDELTGLAASIVLIILLTTKLDASSTENVARHKVNQGKYQYYDFTTANCVTFALELIRGIIPDRIDAAGRDLWGTKYNFSGIYTVSKGFKLLSNV